MRVVVLGAHGQIAMHLHDELMARGHEVRGLVRNPRHVEELEAVGVEPVVCDVEERDDIAEPVGHADAVVFAAGAGPGSGAARKWTVDRDGAIKLMEAARTNGIQRYVMVSAMRLEKPRGSEVFQTYLRAKAEADEALRDSGLDHTIVKPGRLTDDPGRAGGPGVARPFRRRAPGGRGFGAGRSAGDPGNRRSHPRPHRGRRPRGGGGEGRRPGSRRLTGRFEMARPAHSGD